MKVEPADIAWAAGVFDALGMIRMRTMDTGAVLPCAQISSANFTVLNRLAAMTGTKITQVTRNYNRLGCGEHCVEAHQHVLSVTGRFQLVGVKAYIFLAAIQPHLVHLDPREGIAAGAVAPFKPAVRDKMLDLGWPDPQEER